MADFHRLNTKQIQVLKDLAEKLRIHSITSTQASKSGHPTSCASCAEIMSVLFFNVMKFKVNEPRHPANDRFIMSKGHACPILYAAWAETGLFPVSELEKLRKIDNDLEGHPTPRLNFIDVATGSLGQGLSCAAGMAYVGKYYDKSDYRVFCLVGDGESAEGSIWEALSFSSHYKLDNLVAIFDINRLGQSDPTAFQHDMDVYRARLEAFGWNTHVVEGHNIEKIVKALYHAANEKGKPTCLLCKTFKGHGFPDIADKMNYHGKPLGDKAEATIEIINQRIVNKEPHGLTPQAPTAVVPDVDIASVKLAEPLPYKKGQKYACRKAYGDALVRLGKNCDRVIAMDGDTKNSTFSQIYRDAFPDRYVECFIAEQNLVGVGIGAACRDRAIVFVSSFAAFFSRAYDQIRMGAISQTNLNIVGSHCGISIGEDGPSQMALEDIAMFRAVPTATVFYPSDAVSMERAVELSAQTKGIGFIRSTRNETEVLYANDEEFHIGKAKIVRESSSDQVTVIGAGITLPEALKAADTLAEANINIRVIDPFTIKPLDASTILHSAKATGGRIVTVEDHYHEGGIGDAVLDVVAGERDIVVKKLAVRGVPRSGKAAQLLAMFEIDADAIVKAVKEILKA